MIRWVFAIFLGLTIFYPLLPDVLARLRVGRWPGYFLFQFRGIVFCLPFSSTLLASLLAFLLAKLAGLV